MGSGRRLREPKGPYEAVIQDLTHEGRGVARQDGKAVFVPDTLPGERVSYLSVFRRRDFDEGKLLEVLEASPQRVAPRCPHFGVCGGCSLQHLDPAAQVEFKQRQLLESLRRVGKVSPASLLPPVTGPIWGYRRRARLSVRHVPKKDRVLVGFKERDRSVVADIRHCDVLAPVFGGRIAELAALVGDLDIRDSIPQIEVAVGDDAPGMVLRVLRAPGESDRKKLEAYSAATGIRIWLDPGNAGLQPLWPDTPGLHYRLPHQAIEIGFAPGDFVQVNAGVNARMVDSAIDLLDLQPQDRVLELFCGIGNFSLPMARRAAQVVAAEGEEGLVERARINAAVNGISNVEYHIADLTRADGGSAWLNRSYDKLLLDPPRAGAREMVPAMAAIRPRRLVYVSCHPGTLARDAGMLVHDHGYRLLAAGIMDMFPHTSHVESMALFTAD